MTSRSTSEHGERVFTIIFPAIGLFASVMWPLVVSFGLNPVTEFQGSFSGILGTGIIGGAVVPVIIGHIGAYAGLRSGLAFLYLTFRILLSVGFLARPVINNATIRLKKASEGVAS